MVIFGSGVSVGEAEGEAEGSSVPSGVPEGEEEGEPSGDSAGLTDGDAPGETEGVDGVSESGDSVTGVSEGLPVEGVSDRGVGDEVVACSPGVLAEGEVSVA